MIYRVLADIIFIVHLIFILFVVLGGLFVIKYPRMAFIHLPAMIWGAVVEFCNIICPLTPWENHFRELGGAERYETDFVEKYLIPLVYPEGLTVKTQFVLGCFVVLINAIVYSIAVYRLYKRRKMRAKVKPS